MNKLNTVREIAEPLERKSIYSTASKVGILIMFSCVTPHQTSYLPNFFKLMPRHPLTEISMKRLFQSSVHITY